MPGRLTPIGCRLERALALGANQSLSVRAVSIVGNREQVAQIAGENNLQKLAKNA